MTNNNSNALANITQCLTGMRKKFATILNYILRFMVGNPMSLFIG